MEIYGSFSTDISSHYCFKIERGQISKNVENAKFIGNHEKDKSNASVTRIFFLNCEMSIIPRGLTKFFPNFTSLSVSYSKDLREIRKEDLRGYEKLKEISFYNCNLSYLPGNLFEDLKDLESISFYNNPIEFIGENLLDGLDKLEVVDFTLTKNLRLTYFNRDKISPEKLELIKQEIREKCAPNFEKISEIRRIEYINSKDELLKRITELQKFEEIVSDIKRFSRNESFKDINVKIEQEEFKLHKFILAARSPTFAEIFTKNPIIEELNLDDVSIETFKIFIDFICNNRLPKKEINSYDIFKLGGRMKVENLKEFAAAKLINEINAENSFEVLTIAHLYHDDELRGKAFEEIKKMFPTININDALAKIPEKIKCNYDCWTDSEYSCSIERKKIPKNVEIVRFVGNHKDGQSNASVTNIEFNNCEIEKIPEGLLKVFPNLTTLKIFYSKDLRGLTKKDFDGLGKLKVLTILGCSLEYLPSNLFEDMKNLEEIDFEDNKIMFIGENFLNGLMKLKIVDFKGNENIDLCFKADKPESSTLDEIKKEIREKCALNFEMILEKQANDSNEKQENLLKQISELEEKLKKSDENLKKKDEIIDQWKYKNMTLLKKIF